MLLSVLGYKPKDDCSSLSVENLFGALDEYANMLSKGSTLRLTVWSWSCFLYPVSSSLLRMTFLLMAHLCGQAPKLSLLYNMDFLPSSLSFLPGSVYLCWEDYILCVCMMGHSPLRWHSSFQASCLNLLSCLCYVSHLKLWSGKNCFVSELAIILSTSENSFLRNNFLATKWTKQEYVIRWF